jgi:hypothetical protein
VVVEQPKAEPIAISVPPHPELEGAISAGDQTAWQIYADWLIEQGISWGEVMAAALQGTPNSLRQQALERALFGTEPKKVVWNRGVMDQLTFIPEGENKPPMHEVLEAALKHPAGHFVRELTLGLPPDLNLNWHLEDLAQTIAKVSPLPCLRKLDMSVTSPAMDQISWRRVGDISCIWKAVPQLEELLLQGSQGSDGKIPSKLAPIDAPKLKRFVFISGGLDESVPLELAAAQLPSLEHLELWLGEPNYGCTVTMQSLAGILSGERMPKLTSLAIKNSGEEGTLIEAVAKSALLPRLEELDFSMGVLAEGATAAFLRYAEKFKHLKRLDLSDNYFSGADQVTLRAALPMIVFGEQKPSEGPDDRYVSVSE